MSRSSSISDRLEDVAVELTADEDSAMLEDVRLPVYGADDGAALRDILFTWWEETLSRSRRERRAGDRRSEAVRQSLIRLRDPFQLLRGRGAKSVSKPLAPARQIAGFGTVYL